MRQNTIKIIHDSQQFVQGYDCKIFAAVEKVSLLYLGAHVKENQNKISKYKIPNIESTENALGIWWIAPFPPKFVIFVFALRLLQKKTPLTDDG